MSRMYYIFQASDTRNRYYVIDLKGNKIFYGTLYGCKKFVNYMTEGGDSNVPGNLEQNAETMYKPLVSMY